MLLYQKKYNFFFDFQVLQVTFWDTRGFFRVYVSWNIRKAFGAFIFRSIRNFLVVDFLYFLRMGWKMQGSIWGNICVWGIFLGWILFCFFLCLGLDVAHVAPNYITKVSPSLTCRWLFQRVKDKLPRSWQRREGEWKLRTIYHCL